MHQVQTERSEGRITLRNSLFNYELSVKTAGFPSSIGFGDGTEVFSAERPILSVNVDGRTAYPSMKQGFDPTIIEADGCTKVAFDDIRWAYEDGTLLPDYRLALYYEVFGDGVVFVRTFFFTETLTPGTIESFILEPGIILPEGCETNWSWWEFPNAANAKLIQALNGFARNLPQGQNASFENEIIPFVSFDLGKKGKRDMHCEFFLECFSPLIPDEVKNTRTDIFWEEGGAHVAWNFQKEALFTPGRAYQWRNTWGWSLTRFPAERKHSPLRLFHYLDNFERYPSEEVIREAAAEGANLFMLHENWRLDTKQDEFAHDKARLVGTIENIHKCGMRTALYVRGNEDGIRQDYAEPLRPYLKKDWDGLYMDFGSPACFLGLDEYAQGGRMQFREYHRMMRKLREFVGEEGLLLSHSGAFFASMAHTLVDAYVSGEQEKGQLIKDRTLHAYFAGLSVAPSSLWTASFPTYRTNGAVPYLASTAQTPFIILGTQNTTSSLDHPKVPSVITFQRPLWRLWELLDGNKDVKVYTTQSTEEVFDTDDQTGACLIVTNSGDALLIATNFCEKNRLLDVKIDWQRLEIQPKPVCIELSADYQSCSWRENVSLTADAAGFGVAGWLFVSDVNPWRKQLEKFSRPYHCSPEREQNYYQSIEHIRQARFDAPVWKECYLQASVPNYPNNYEDSLIFDLYENQLQLQDITAVGAPRVLGYVGAQGLTAKETPKSDILMPGESSVWIPLHEVLGKDGDYTLELATKRGGGDFYNLVSLCLSPVAGSINESREVVYSNAIDSDWSLLSFKIGLK